ncbi:MAG TPA: IS4 family transposase [Halococcus sp.]|nr:IS4 family transposase [Halococcus sp.]
METSPDRVVDGFTELLDEVDSEAIANEHRVGIHSNRIDFEEYAKIGAFLGIHDPKTLDDLDQQTDVRDGLEPISQGHFSRLTNRRPWEAFADLANAILQLPQFYHAAGDVRLQLEDVCDRWIVGFDKTNLPIRTTMLVEIDGDLHELRPEYGGLRLHTAARLSPASSHPIGTVVTDPNTHETNCFEDLLDQVEVHEDLDDLIAVFDMGYVDYDRFCSLKRWNIDFVIPLKKNARYTVTETLCEKEFETTEDGDVTHVTDELIELSSTGEEFRHVTVRIADGDADGGEKVNRYLTTLGPESYDPLDVAVIYAVRWLLEIMFRKLKQYFNVQEFHSKTLNGALVELFCALIAYVLADYYHRTYRIRGTVVDTIKIIRNFWDKPRGEIG